MLQKAGHLGKRSTEVGPANDYTLLIDTGSSNTWIGASKTYIQTSTSEDTGNTISLSYGSGSISGEDQYSHPRFQFGYHSPIHWGCELTSGFSGVDGILGVGPVDLTSGTVNNTNTVPTVSDNILSQGTISEEVLGIYYVPASEASTSGTLTFGGCDDSVMTGSGIDQSITYDGNTILSTAAGIVDTGTTLILIATNAFQTHQSATGGTLDSATGLLTVTFAQYSALQTLSFVIGGQSYDFAPNAQILPRSLNSAIGGTTNSIYLVVSDIGSQSGSGLDFINGYAFLERNYSVFDTINGQVGFVTTAYTKATTS